ncbi:MAG: sulfurtransferase-like selenium metabolism protein YedF [Deltaproteobacteria bacterium]|nr:sulfurtransferase-like selenium metabolism protein YedF [Deltaproteobacteria bacterium]
MTETRQTELAGQACCAAGPILADEGQAQTGEVKKTLVLLATDSLGRGDEVLGRHIVTNFIRTMKEMGDDLWRLVLLNGAVKLTVEGSEALPYLQELAERGLGILVCGPCLKTFNLAGQNQVGGLTSMLDIITSMQLADKVISLT